ncbi:MAG: phosphoribosylglycinamide formyltransferase [Rickettsiales bacterium]|jgi:phosphoribosylglycinamide formyltransferase 1|nr:phosphoribosylglycinamide formyltransferase [Rickettsiales bacterium]|tara:strand:- start:3897 stop:4493 length:597 start_codon:yes stop_codon:yes gene_type:complete
MDQNKLKKTKLAILISGRGSNMRSIINSCKEDNFPAEVNLVISNNPNAPGIKFAQDNNIDIKVIDHNKYKDQPDSRKFFEEAIHNHIIKYDIDIICLAGFMRILSPFFINKWKNKIINIHPSLLPDFKGANAVREAFNAKAKEYGCTVHFVDQEVDNGKIIMQHKVEVNKDDDLESIKNKILEKEHILYSKAIKLICN